MRPEIEWARDTAVEALTINPTLVPWAFEYTPASSDSAVTTYLDKVREADIFVWLAGAITTEPVRAEVQEALAHGRRMWVIVLPATHRDELTSQLLREVRNHAKTAAAEDANELRELLSLTFSDEVIRAMRETPGLDRLAHLEQVARRSRARMVSRWIAVGLETAEAIALADDPSVGAPAARVLPDDERRLVIVVGDVGAGKSVVAERALQVAVLQAREWPSAPIPVFLRMRNIERGLEAAIRARTDAIGDIRAVGVFAVVDGAEEADSRVAANAVEEARELVAALPQTRILITSRPTAALRRGVPERVDLPLLTSEEARSLVSSISGSVVTIGIEGSWPSAIRDAVRRPLFAVLLGLNRRVRRPEPQTTGELLDTLVEYAIEPLDIAEVLPALRRLAALVTDCGGPIDRSELGDLTSRAAANASRLVREDDNAVDFALPLLTQWFAAEALAEDTAGLAELVVDRSRLDRWRYALAIALNRGTHDFIDRVMTQLIGADPGFAAEIVDESFRRWGTGEIATTRGTSAAGAGAELRAAFETWGEAIKPLDGLLLPRRSDGSLAPLGVDASGGHLTFGWYRGLSVVEPVVELPSGLTILRSSPEWNLRRSGVWSNGRGWAWRWALDALRNDLERFLAERSLPSDDPALIDEALWVLALAAAGKGGLYQEPIPLDVVQRAAADFDPAVPLIRLNDRYAPTELVLMRLRALIEAGAREIRAPWPGPDLTQHGGWIWDPYSPEKQQQRTEAIYGAALRAYTSITDTWFPKLKSRMRVAVTLPATLRGTLRPAPTQSGFENAPTMSWWLDPLPYGEESTVEVVLEDGSASAHPRGSREWREQLNLRHQKLVDLRPEAAGWISTVETHGLSDVFQGAPLAPLVYDWVKADLAAIKWR